MGGAGQRRFRIGLAAAAAALAGVPVVAQDDGAGGLRFTFGIDNRQFLHSNGTLTPGGDDESFETNTQLSFGIASVTPESYFTADASVRLRYIKFLDGGDNLLRDGLVNPDLRLSWGRDSAAARIDATAFWNEIDLAQDRTIDDFDSLTGKRQTSGGTIAYRWGEDRRWGFGLRAAVRDTNFIDAPGETDWQRAQLGADVRLDLSEAMTLTFDASRNRFKEAGEDPSYSTRVSADLSIARPNGTFVIGANADYTDEGTRTGLSFGRQLDLPSGSLGVRLGLTRGVDGELSTIGTLDWVHVLPNGQISVSLSRGVTSGETTDSETRTTRVALGLTHDLSPRAVLSADFGYAESVETSTGDTTRNGSAGVMVTYDVGQDWLLDAGVRRRLRDDPDTPEAVDNAIFLGLRKTFERQY